MKKGEHRLSPYREYVADRLRHRGIVCISPEWTRWAKRYVNHRYRRKKKDESIEELRSV